MYSPSDGAGTGAPRLIATKSTSKKEPSTHVVNLASFPLTDLTAASRLTPANRAATGTRGSAYRLAGWNRSSAVRPKSSEQPSRVKNRLPTECQK